MRKKHVWIGLVGIVVVAAAISLVALPSRVEWTTSSPAALEEFELAGEARMKLYHPEAMAHLERAVELDPDFVFAKLLLSDFLRWEYPERATALFEEVLQADRSRLRPRERFFIDRAEAYSEERIADAEQLTKEYFEKHPNDPFILENVATAAFNRGESEKAERLYRRLLEVAPNWVTAYNQLGYLTMRQGRFPEAEEYFTSYRFIAPDQANPHDSLAELYTIQGRYDDARTSLDNALEIKPDFWASYFHLIQAYVMMRDFDAARQVLETWRSQEGAMERELETWGCVVDSVERMYDRSWDEILDGQSSSCVEKSSPTGSASRAVHRAACQVADWELAEQFENRVREQIEKIEKAQKASSDKKNQVVISGLRNMEGIRLALQGDYEGAETRFREADAELQYLETGPAIFKLYNRLLIVETLFAQGRDVEAHKLLAKVRSVNPSMVEEFEADGLKLLGLERG